MKVSFPVPDQVKYILDLFEKNGFEIFVVGGVVRDLLLGRTAYDWDFTTNALPEEIVKLVPESYYDNTFGTVGVKAEDARPFEITTFRSEKGYTDGRHPDEVVWGKVLAEDLARRDFTINAMALKKMGGKASENFELVDLFGGQKDLEAKLVRTVGKANERFSEDALRLMRAVRIAAQLQFSIEEATFGAIQNNATKLQQVSAERVRDELIKILASDYPADGYLLLKNTGLGQFVLPELEAAFGVEQKSPGRHHIYDVGTHSVEALRNCPSTDPITRLATLLHDVGKAKTQKIFPDGKITFYNHEMESEKIAVRVADRLRRTSKVKCAQSC